MPIKKFPSLNSADEDGLIALGGDLKPESLILAYSSGIFPWPIAEHGPIPWFSPPKRALLFLKDFRPSKRLLRQYRNTEYSFAIDQDFRQVIESCASIKRKNSKGSWINKEMQEAYCKAKELGFAHSFECYEGSELIAGIYGISISRMFAGESMFHKRTNASKLCFCFLVEHLREKDVEWIDCQQMSPLLASFGAKEIDRKDFLALLKEALI